LTLTPRNDPNCLKTTAKEITTVPKPDISKDLIGENINVIAGSDAASKNTVQSITFNKDSLLVTSAFLTTASATTLTTGHSSVAGLHMNVTPSSREEVDISRNPLSSSTELTYVDNTADSSKRCQKTDLIATPVAPEFKGGAGAPARVHKKSSAGKRGKLETKLSVASDNRNVHSDIDRDTLRSAQSMQAVCDSNSNTDVRQYVQEQSGADGRLTVCGEWYGRPLINNYERRGSSEAIRTTITFSRSQESSPRGRPPSIGRNAWSKSQDISSIVNTNDAWSRSPEIHPKVGYHANRRKSAHCIGLHSDRVSPNQVGYGMAYLTVIIIFAWRPLIRYFFTVRFKQDLFCQDLDETKTFFHKTNT